jgi:putative ABC transport system permease protein
MNDELRGSRPEEAQQGRRGRERGSSREPVAGAIRPPRLGEWILRRTLPAGVAGESIKGDLDQEYRELGISSPGKGHGTWYLAEALKLGVRFGLLRFLEARSPFRRTGVGQRRMGRGERTLLEVGQGFRLLVRSPGLALFAAVAMGLGIGATATMFSVSHGLLRDLPYGDPDRLAYVGWTPKGEPDWRMQLTAGELLEWREAQSTLESLSAVRVGTMDVAGTEGPPERVSGGQITRDAFETLRVQPMLGRGFLPEDEAEGSPEVVILGHDLWLRRFGGDPEILGRTVRVNGTVRTVVGIMPEKFRFPELEDLWTPIRMVAGGEAPGKGPRAYRALGRLRDGVTIEEARAEFGTLAHRIALAHPEAYEDLAYRVIPYYEYYVGRDAVVIMNTLVVIASFVLLIACASVANLLLARALGRSRELAVRSAMGASRGRIMAQLLSESLIIAVPGGVLGALIAWVGAGLFHNAVAEQLPFYWMDCRVDGAVLVFVGILVLVAGVLAGLVPALRVSGTGPGAVLKDGDRGSSSLKIGRLSRSLVVGEVALSFGLLTTAGMMAKGPLLYLAKDPGFDSESLFTAQVGLRQEAYPVAEDWDRFFQRLLPGLEAIPGVRSATLTSSLPGIGAPMGSFRLGDRVYEREVDLPRARTAFVGPDFFPTLGVKAVSGRLFGAGDDSDGEPVAIVNESFARRHFPGEGPLGKRILLDSLETEGPWVTVVGVVPDLRMNGSGPDGAEGMYFPLSQRPQRSAYLLLQAGADPMELTPAVRAALAEVDPDVPLGRPLPLQEAMSQEIRAEALFFTLLLVCGSLALVLAAVGLFGVLAFSVRRRTREIGIRLALGAAVGSVLWSTLRSGITQVSLGLAAGGLLALALSPLVSGLFYADKLVEWGVYGVVATLMLTTGFAASLIPAVSVTRVDPVEALKQE